MRENMTITSALTTEKWTRRGFLATTGAVGAGVALVSTANFTFAAPTAAAEDDVNTAKFAASLEVLAVNTYKAALDAAGAGKLGTVPPAVATYAKTAMDQHQFALDQWNNVIKGAGGAAVTQPPADLNATVQTAFGKVTDVNGVAELALLLEQIAADTYFKAIPTLTIPAAIDLAGNFQIIDQQHQSVLLFVMGKYPVPDVFQKGDKAASPSAASPAPAAAPAAPAQPAAPKPSTAAAPPPPATPVTQMPRALPNTGDGSSLTSAIPSIAGAIGAAGIGIGVALQRLRRK